MNKILSLQSSKNKLLKEIQELKDKRKINSEIMNEVRNQGEITENAEFLEAKSENDGIERKLDEIDNKLSLIEIIDLNKITKNGKIKFGTVVELLYIEEDREVKYQILGPLEADPSQGIISYESPLGRELIGKEEGDEFVLMIGDIESDIEIISVD